MNPSSFYRSDLWRAGLAGARLLPRGPLEAFAGALAFGYGQANAARREVVVRNLLPALGNDRPAAARMARRLFRQFGLKLADLWRYESGCKTGFGDFSGAEWARFEAVRARGRGLLLLTPHLGNWEFGAPFLRQRGVSLQVITQAEPQPALTRLRQESRARRGVETLVIGENPFAFVEVIRRLEAGATVALLVDRPPAGSAVAARLWGRPFSASIAPAELARASGCALLPASILRNSDGSYRVEMLPEIEYDRTTLGTREARAQLSQTILTAFEPAIRAHLDQWFHFVPLWPGQA